MCDSKIKKLCDNLSTNNTNKKRTAIRSVIEKFQSAENLRSDIVNLLLKGLVSFNDEYHRGYLESFRWVLENMNEELLSMTVSQMKECLFLILKDATIKENSSNKLGSILALDALLTSTDISKIDKSSLLYFYKYVLLQLHDVSFGFISTFTIINLFKKIKIEEFKTMLKDLQNEIFNLESIDRFPQHLLLWLSFSSDQKKALKADSKIIPIIHSKEVLSKLPNVLKSCKRDQLITIFNYLTISPEFKAIWKYLNKLNEQESGVKFKQVFLLMAFECICPQPNSLIINKTEQNRLALINIIWSDKNILKFLMKQLANPEYELYAISREFVLKINGNPNRIYLEQLFKLALELGQDLIAEEFKISQTLRLTNSLFAHVTNGDIFNSYIDNMKAYFDSGNFHQKIYAIEQLSSGFIKCPVKNYKIPEFLLNINHVYNYETTDSVKSSEIEATRSAFLKCLNEMIATNQLDQLKNLLEINSKIVTNNDLKDRNESVLEFYNCPKEISKKRTASLRETNCDSVDLTNNTNAMFVSLLTNLCLYMTTQQCDEETIEIFDDVVVCFNQFRTEFSSDKEIIKKSKIDLDSDEIANENDWRIILSDVLIVLLEQNCLYLRTLSSQIFKTMVTENLCNTAVIEHINMAIENSQMQTRNIDKKESDNKNNNIDVEPVESSDSSCAEETDINEADVVKARIFSALGSMVTDVHSDSDDNCPEVEEPDTSESEEENALLVKKDKKSIKQKRYTLVQLKNFRNRCIDLLETVFVHAPELTERVLAFSHLMKQAQKSHLSVNIENRLLKAIAHFKKYQPPTPLSDTELVSYLNRLLDGVDKCNLSKPTIQIYSELVVAFLRMNRENGPKVVEFFKPIIDKCINERKMHSTKAIFLRTFDSFPEICWSFHGELLKYINGKHSDQTQYQAVCIIKNIITNRAIKDIVHNQRNTFYANKKDILDFVSDIGQTIAVSIANTDFQSHPKNAALFIGLLVECLKLGGFPFSEKIDKNISDKIKNVKINSIPMDLRKEINKFVAAADCATKSLKSL